MPRTPSLLVSALTLPGLLALAALVLPPAEAAEMGPRFKRSPPAAEDGMQARVIVKYRSGSALMQKLSASDTQKVAPRHAAALGQRLGYALQNGRVLGDRTQALRGQGLASSELVNKLRQQADVEWAVVDERRYISSVPNDPYYGPGQTSITPAVGQWYLRAPDSTIISAINAPPAWDITKGAASITVAVLDTGVRYDHPDLAGKLHPGYDFVSDSTSAGDGGADSGGRDADATDPGDYSTANECGRGSAASSSTWHGTQTAGLVGAATDNNLGMASVGRNVMVLPVRVLGKCGGSDSDIIAAMYWAAGLAIPGDSATPANPHPAKVISMSLGKSGSCPASYAEVFSTLNSAGVTVVVAAGNDAGLAVSAPANCTGALAVGGLRHLGTKVGFSSVGPQVAISAPAGNCVNLSGACLYPILTTINASTTTPTTNTYSDSTNYSVGTSFSTPIVAGAVALMLSVDPTLAPAVVKSKLQATARPFPTTGAADTVGACRAPTAADQLECYCTTTTCGAGMLDVGAAVAAVAPVVVVSPPTASITLSAATPTAGETVTLSAATSVANGGRSLASYQWTVTGGGALAAISGASTGSTATLLTTAAGAVTISLTVTDSAGASGNSSATISVQAVATTPVAPASTGGGGGGGAMSGLWLALLALGVGALWRSRPPSA